MATWNGVITNAGNRLLNEWVNEKTLNFDSAASGQGTVAEVAMMAQTALVNEKQVASLLGGEKVASGIRLKLRIAAPDTAYTLNQFRVSASVDGGSPAMLALFQLEQGIPIPSKTESPDFVYTFYALISCSNTGTWTVTVDTSACVTQGDMTAAITEAVRTKQDKLTGTPGQVVGFDEEGNAVPQAGGGVMTFNGRSGAVVPAEGDYTAEMVGARPESWIPSAADTGAVPITEKGAPNGVATLGPDGKVPGEQLPKMDYDPAGSAAAVQNALSAHTGNKNNPHAVTAEQVGAFTKQETLTPETAALYGLSSSAIPDDVLSFLGKYNQHWWRRRESKSHYEAVISQATEEDVLNTVNAFMVNINYSSDITISSSGKVTLLAPIKNLIIEENDLSRSGTGVSKANTLKGKYWNGTMIGPSDYERDLGDRYTAPNAPNAKMTDYGDYKKLTLQSSAVSTKFVDGIGPWEYVQSNDRKAYPDSGIVEGVEYQYLGIPFANIVTAPTIVTGSYVGTGKTGKSNPNQITLAEPFKILCIYGMQWPDSYRSIDNSGTGETSVIIPGSIIPTEYTSGFGFFYSSNSRDSYGKKSADGKTFSWYYNYTPSDAATVQLNLSQVVYHYYAIV